MCIKQRNNTSDKKLGYHALTPVSDIENHKEYCDALEWALSNKKIKNIALTGSYGSGKTSVLYSFRERERKNKSKEFKFLDISLASFKDETTDKDSEADRTPSNDSTKTTDEQLRLIELSILQQIIYHAKSKDLPHSRLKKIRSIKPTRIYWLTALIFSFIISLSILFKHEWIMRFSNVQEFKPWIKYVVLAVFIGTLVLLLKRSVKFLHNLSSVKLNLKNLEIQIDENTNKSILNSHLDEILYFFEVTKYNVVIIEDLDRFEQTEVFTKLREINLLINNSKSIDRHIVFIYAVRDDIFRENNRTKFFDFIIPIIPIVSQFVGFPFLVQG